MIAFKQFITESRSAPLYHGTSAQNAVLILKSNLLKAGYEERVSFTRDFKYAGRMVKSQGYSSTVIFEVDQKKLTHNYKIAPVNFWYIDKNSNAGERQIPTRMPANYTNRRGNFENEYEESVKGSIKNFSKFITKIYIDNERSHKELMTAIPNLHDIGTVVIGIKKK